MIEETKGTIVAKILCYTVYSGLHSFNTEIKKGECVSICFNLTSFDRCVSFSFLLTLISLCPQPY